MATTWDPADKSAGTTLSSGNHVASSTSGNNGALSVGVTHTTGKWYFEFTTNTNNGTCLLGVANTTYNYGNTAADGTNAAGINGGGSAAVFAGTFDPGWGVSTGRRIGVAVDLDNDKIWFRYDGGNWNNAAIGSQDPANNVGGYGIGTFGGAAVHIVERLQNSGSVTLNAGDSAFVDSAPSGFTAWDSTPPPQYFRATLLCYSPRERGFVGYRGGKRR